VGDKRGRWVSSFLAAVAESGAQSPGRMAHARTQNMYQTRQMRAAFESQRSDRLGTAARRASESRIG